MTDIDTIKDIINDAADYIETGKAKAQKVKVGLTLLGSEHGPQELIRGAREADRKSVV